MHTVKIPSGLLDNKYEFFNTEDNVMFFHSGETKPFEDLSFPMINILLEKINQEPEAKLILMDWFPNSEFQQIKKFVSCRFGGIDYKADFENDTLQEGEYWNCPNLGNCPGQGKVCKNPTYNGEKISDIEIKLIQLSTSDMTNEVIADTLGIAMGSYHKMKAILHKKLGNIQTKQCLTKIAYSLNII